MPWASFSIHDGGYSDVVRSSADFDGIWEHDQPMYQMRRPMINAGTYHLGADVLFTLDFVESGGSPFRVHANAGYHYYKQHFEYTDYRYTSRYCQKLCLTT